MAGLNVKLEKQPHKLKHRQMAVFMRMFIVVISGAVCGGKYPSLKAP